MLNVAPSVPEGIISADFEAFRKRTYQLTGLDFTSYKAPHMHRRLSAPLGTLHVKTFAEYARVLEELRCAEETEL